MRKKRIIFASLCFFLVFSVLMIRISYIVLSNSNDYSSKVSNQIENKTLLYYPRGKVYDRKFIPLSGRINNENGIPIIQYDNLDVGEDVVGKLTIDSTNRTENGIKGVSAIQSIYDSKLNGGMPMQIVQYKDGLGTSLKDNLFYVYGDHQNSYNSVQLSLDYHIQKITETIIETAITEKNYKGIAVVVMDVKTGDILAMASTGDQTNKSVLCYQPGSLFKILVAGKALEKGVVDLDSPFSCKGNVDIDGNIRRCYEEDGHGDITFLDAFAQSCNAAFYKTALLLNEYDSNGNIIYNEVLDLAIELGFQPQSEEKIKEFLLSYDYSYPMIPDKIFNKMDTFNLALGQGVIMSSPLMMTKVMSAIANNGVMNEPRLILNELDAKDKVIKKFETENKRIFTEEVNNKLKIMLSEVCKIGTGKNNSLQDFGGLAGKSGTAQHLSHKENHAWFSGYFPANEPRYAMTIFVEEGGTSTTAALPIFNNLALEILNLYP